MSEETNQNSILLEKTEKEIVNRHRKESRDLIATVTSLKKQATKGEKKKKKQILKDCENLEQELKQKHVQELRTFRQHNNDKTEDHGEKVEDGEKEESDDEFSPEKLLAQLELEAKEATEESTKKTANKANPHQDQPKGPKRNRQKERLAKRALRTEEMIEEAKNEAAAQPDLKKIEAENIQALCQIRKLQQHDIAPDGHCLFASVSDQLNTRHNADINFRDLRKQASDFIRSDPDSFSPFLFDEETLSMKDINVYCDELVNTAIWGGDMEILAFSKLYNCPITVIMSGRSALTINENGSNPELMLAYYKHSYGLGEHYNSLRDL
ncbi:cysteine proteinase [Nadsonia fulvescens var. elongata DSM 6958]|uniref:Cysteine proteinase n=1 Tax=Nadsonia fulvescens var. elongata DSM 6958 TaxID=857566 RepID=A0A1E3PPG9_9ASCO|nr:cysteine proteinase [Nadsonia fulvescens var. elongata DSM 6958]